jgi:flavoprotein
MSHDTPRRILWAITGAGHHLEATFDAMEDVSARGTEVRPMLSVEGARVVRMYGLTDRLDEGAFSPPVIENGPTQAKLLSDVYRGRYSVLLVAPASANTVAKVVCGIADALVPNMVAQAIKCGVVVTMLPTDIEEGDVVTALPGGRTGTLTMRPVDVANARRLGTMMSINVLRSPSELGDALSGF